MDVHEAVPILLYNEVAQCQAPGRNAITQVVAQLEMLNALGYQFVTPDMLAAGGDSQRVMVVFVRPDPLIVAELTDLLKRINGRAVMALNTGAQQVQIAGNPRPEVIPRLLATGRWLIGSCGPVNLRNMVISEDKKLGNPLTHAFVYETRGETLTPVNYMENTLREASVSLENAVLKVFVYPNGDYGQLSLNTTQEAVDSLKRTVERYFDFAVCLDSNGFIGPELDRVRLPARYVPVDWEDEQFEIHIRENNPFTRSKLELGKSLYWHTQHERSNLWFEEAEAAGANAVDVNFNWGANANIQGDVPTAMKKLRQARELKKIELEEQVGAELEEEELREDLIYSNIVRTLVRAAIKKHPFINPSWHRWDDTDGRKGTVVGADAGTYIGNHVQFGAFGYKEHLERDGYGEVDALRLGGSLLYHFAPERWIQFRGWYLDIKDINDHIGGTMSLHLANTPWSGTVDLVASHEEIDTVEAYKEEIWSNRFALQTYQRIADVWNLFANFTYQHRTDKNDTFLLNGRFVRRLKEWPYFGVGYLYRFGWSDFDPPEYYAPEDLQQHQLYAQFRGGTDLVRAGTKSETGQAAMSWSLLASGQAGYAREKNTNWRFIWGARIQLTVRFTDHVRVYAEYRRQESPTYKRNDYILGFQIQL